MLSSIRDVRTLRATHLCFLKNPLAKTISHTSEAAKKPSFTVSYLVDSCGLSSKAALLAAKRIQLDTTETPNSVLKLFKNHGFTKTHIKNLIIKFPSLLLADPDKNLKPKLDFFQGLGFSGPKLPKILCSSPRLLIVSLEDRIIPCFDFLKTLLHTNENIGIAVKRSSLLLQYNLQKTVAPNIEMLRNQGLPEFRISKLLMVQPGALMRGSHHFNSVIELLKEMRFNASDPMFVYAVGLMAYMNKSTWESKLVAYRSSGWSDDMILSAFRKQPICMKLSEGKIRKTMDFFVSKIKLAPAYLSARPTLMLFSLEKRIIPRSLVLNILLSKGKIKRASLYRSMVLGEKNFLEKYVIKYQEEIPEVLSASQGKMGFIDVEMVSKQVTSI